MPPVETNACQEQLQTQSELLAASPFSGAVRSCLQSLYDSVSRALTQLRRIKAHSILQSFVNFIKMKIVEQATVRLGMFSSLEDRGDLGDGAHASRASSS